VTIIYKFPLAQMGVLAPRLSGGVQNMMEKSFYIFRGAWLHAGFSNPYYHLTLTD
jgi:hypothetical protein